MSEMTKKQWSYWLRFDSWALWEAATLVMGWNPEDHTELIQGNPVHRIEDLAGRSISAGTLKTLDDDRVIPSVFLAWASTKGIPIPEQLKPLLGEQEEQSLTPQKQLNRPSQRHRERCRAIAELLWGQDPERTIADMIISDEITKYGCEGHNYTEQTLRMWINDLAPDRSPGRRSNK